MKFLDGFEANLSEIIEGLPSTLLRYPLLAAVCVSALAVATLAATGRVETHSLLNAQGWFGLSLTMLVFVMSTRSPAKEPAALDRRDVLYAALMSALAVAACWRVLGIGFLSDDFILVRRALKEEFWLAATFTQGGGDGFYRPLGNLSFHLTAALAGGNAVLWHAGSLAIHATNTALLFLLARKFGLTKSAASMAAALFAIHGTRPEAVAWIAARFDLIMLFFVLCGLLLYQCEGIWAPVLALICMVCALLTKEAAYAFPLLLLLLGPARKTIPFFLGAGALFAYRWTLLGGIGGYRSAGTDDAAALHFGILPVMKVLGLRLWSVLYLPINRAVEQQTILIILTIVYMGILIFAAGQRIDRRQWTRAVLFLLAACIPPLHQLLIGLDLEKSRLLYLPAVGFCLMMGVLIESQSGRMRWAFCAVLLLFHFAALQNNLNAWEAASDKAAVTLDKASACIGPNGDSATVSNLPRTYKGVYFFANGFAEGLELMRGKPISINQGGPEAAVLTWDAQRQELHCVE